MSFSRVKGKETGRLRQGAAGTSKHQQVGASGIDAGQQVIDVEAKVVPPSLDYDIARFEGYPLRVVFGKIADLVSKFVPKAIVRIAGNPRESLERLDEIRRNRRERKVHGSVRRVYDDPFGSG